METSLHRSFTPLASSWKIILVGIPFLALASAVLGPITFEEIAVRKGRIIDQTALRRG